MKKNLEKQLEFPFSEEYRTIKKKEMSRQEWQNLPSSLKKSIIYGGILYTGVMIKTGIDAFSLIYPEQFYHFLNIFGIK